MKRLIFLLLLIPQICFAQTMISNRDIKQHPATKLFISGNHLVSDFEDISSSNNQITKYADVKTVNETSTTNPKYFPVGNDKGIYFDGTGDYLSLTNSTDFDFGTGDFTLDGWYFTKASAIQTIFSGVTDDSTLLRVLIRTDNNKLAIWYGTGTYEPSYTWALNTWYHIAIVKTSNYYKLFVNGVQIGVDTYSTASMRFYSTLYIGMYGINSGYLFNGFMQNIRISKGIARWTSNFIPPALNSTYATDSYTKLYIKGHDKPVNTTAMTDDSGTSKTITTNGDTKIGYSRGVASYFDGTGDYLNTIDSSDWDFGTDDFTIEFWTNFASVGNATFLANTAVGDANNYRYMDYNNTTKNWYFVNKSSGTSRAAYYFNFTPVAGRWYHMAYVRNGSTMYIFKDGAAQSVTASTAFNGDLSAAYGTQVAASIYGGLYLNGYIRDVKISKGIARYTSNFTPPETEPISDQYTKLLLKQKMLKIPDIATNKTITINNQTMVRNLAKVGKGSIYFDGTDDYLLIGDYADWDLDGNFTIDFWVYLNSTQNQRFIVPYQANASDFPSYCLVYSEGNFKCLVSSSRTSYDIMLATTPAAQNTWYHLALVRSGNNYTFYKNGISVGTASSSSAPAAVTTHMNIGRRSISAYEYAFGYLQDIRITKGKALWTSNFTPPRRSGAY